MINITPVCCITVVSSDGFKKKIISKPNLSPRAVRHHHLTDSSVTPNDVTGCKRQNTTLLAGFVKQNMLSDDALRNYVHN